MKKGHFHINISKKETEEDLIEIRFKNEDTIQVNFSKLVNQSKYFRDKYKYSEALFSMQNEIDKIENDFQMREESIKIFFEVVQEEEVDIPKEHYKDIYTLSEYFCISKLTQELDKIRSKELYKDLEFTIEILKETEKSTNNFERKVTSKIENFLIERINECLLNSKFAELPNSTICRILEKSEAKINQELLFEFIIKTAKTRFILIKFVSLDKLREDKLDSLIEFIEEQDEETRKIYLEYIPFNLSLIKFLKNKNKEILKETREKLKEERMSHEKTKEENKKMKELNGKLETRINEYEEEKKNKEALISKQEEELTRIKKELDKYQLEINKFKDDIKPTKIENKHHTNDVFVAGRDNCNQLGEKPNNKSKRFNDTVISPPKKLSFDPSSFLSYSVYYEHSIHFTNDGSMMGIGNNNSGQITSSLPKRSIDHFTNFRMKDGSGRQLNPVSAVCYEYGTLYMLSKRSGRGRQLLLCDQDINGGDPVFLDIGNHHPVALFGGYSHSSAICSEGEVIFINRSSVKKSPQTRIESVSLPDFEKASSVACCCDSVVVLSSKGRVFTSPVRDDMVLKFSEVLELKDKEIVWVSGTNRHVLAVSKEGRVFGRGSNEFGQLGLGKGIESSSSFTEISSLEGYEIRAAYAGYYHSLFETREGKILSCGYNNYGELLLSSGPSDEVYSPTETTITSGATFCIAGCHISVVFIGDSPPPNTPNTRIQHYE